MQHTGGGWFESHDLKDCIDWLARANQFTEPVVMGGCRRSEMHDCLPPYNDHAFKDGWCEKCGLWDGVTYTEYRISETEPAT